MVNHNWIARSCSCASVVAEAVAVGVDGEEMAARRDDRAVRDDEARHAVRGHQRPAGRAVERRDRDVGVGVVVNLDELVVRPGAWRDEGPARLGAAAFPSPGDGRSSPPRPGPRKRNSLMMSEPAACAAPSE